MKRPAAKDAKQTAATSTGEAQAPSTAGHSWDPPAPQTAQVPGKKRKQKSTEELMKECGGMGITTAEVRINEMPDNVYNEKNPPRATAADKAAAKADEKAAAKAAAEAASRKGQTSLNFEPPRSAAPAAEKGEDVN